MDRETMRMKLTYWAGIIKEANTSGMKISEWCDMNQISHRRYYYWHKKVMHDTYATAVENGLISAAGGSTTQASLPTVPEFAELTMPGEGAEAQRGNNPGINIRCGSFLISVDAEFSEGELARVLRVMRHVK